ncbi:hypothetical protein RF11_05971 [Thelohanellus kitauei]|uniref:Uncharacterized protein n=1 Tax=Thelohanellus kitauei TaxID=669202 RepID=A0A0C2II21_THEKT|nr:hypothetical protein RF11_05971 [Thelohanellus kitauei]
MAKRLNQQYNRSWMGDTTITTYCNGHSQDQNYLIPIGFLVIQVIQPVPKVEEPKCTSSVIGSKRCRFQRFAKSSRTHANDVNRFLRLHTLINKKMSTLYSVSYLPYFPVYRAQHYIRRATQIFKQMYFVYICRRDKIFGKNPRLIDLKSTPDKRSSIIFPLYSVMGLVKNQILILKRSSNLSDGVMDDEDLDVICLKNQLFRQLEINDLEWSLSPL